MAVTEGMRPALLLAVGVVLGASGCGGTKTVTVTQTVSTTTTVRVTTQAAPPQAAPCPGSSLSGAFTGIQGSAGAGQISYRLRLTNTGSDPCWVSGIPQLDLLGKDGSVLPTNVSPAHPGQQTAARVVLQPGASAATEARFSPDVPGGSEQTDGPCEPKAYRLRVLIGGGSLEVPIDPPTPVCERGSMTMDNLSAAG
jgi:hypothetical protein